MSKGKLAIVGVGEVPTGIYPERSRWDIIYDICIQAVRDSGFDKNDIEAVVTVAPQAQPSLAAEISFGKLPEELGLKGCNDICICNAGGASTSNCLRAVEYWDSIPTTPVGKILRKDVRKTFWEGRERSIA